MSIFLEHLEEPVRLVQIVVGAWQMERNLFGPGNHLMASEYLIQVL